MTTFTDKDRKFMNIAKAISELSKDKSTKVGCLIVDQEGGPLTWGYNGFIRGANDEKEEWHERPLKYKVTEHSERNAIYNAARSGIKLLGARAYVTSLPTCPDCTRSLIQSGISHIYLEKKAFEGTNDRSKAWLEDWPISLSMYEQAGVKIIIDE